MMVRVRCSALTLLMLRVFTNDHDFALALNDLALFANGLDGRSDFHWKYLLLSDALKIIWSAK